MSAISRSPYRNPKTEEYVVAHRQTPAGPGSLDCASCGGHTITKADFAADAGVTLNHLNRWLRREPVPPAVAERIRSKVLRVVE